MRYFFAIAVFAASLSEVSLLRAEEGLFSEVAMESVFAKPASTPAGVASKEASDQYDRITSVSSLTEALKAAELNPKSSKNGVKVDLPHEGWKFPVTLAVEIDEDRIRCEMSLIAIDDAGADTETLLDLLALGDAIEGAFFAFDRDKKLIQIRSSLSNRSITPSQLKAELVNLAVFAEKHSEVWKKLESKSTTTNSSGVSNRTVQSQPKPKQSLTVLGRWSASLSSGESFAIQMNADSKFQLVHLKSGKATISKGKATLSGDRLTLAGDDAVTLNCRVTQTSADKFQLTILKSNGDDAVSLDFKKADSTR